MKATFATTSLENFYHQRIVPPKARWMACAQIAYRKVVVLVVASKLDHLRIPPGNRLEALSGDRAGFYSIRINDQWRIVFRWDAKDNAPKEIEIVDYH